MRRAFVFNTGCVRRALDCTMITTYLTQVVSNLMELKEQVPTINLRTMVIIGFPGEADDDFQDTVDAIRAVEFSEVQLNKYEDRPGTPASRILDKIPQEVIDKRYKEIQSYC